MMIDLNLMIKYTTLSEIEERGGSFGLAKQRQILKKVKVNKYSTFAMTVLAVLACVILNWPGFSVETS